MSDLISITSRGYFVKPEYYVTGLPEVIVSENMLPLIKAYLFGDEEDVVEDRLTESSRTKPYSE